MVQGLGENLDSTALPFRKKANRSDTFPTFQPAHLYLHLPKDIKKTSMAFSLQAIYTD
jgi:hypothetical protein